MGRTRLATDDALSSLPTAFSRQDALAAGLTVAPLERLAREGAVRRIAHGLFVKADGDLVDLDLAEARLRAPHSTLCLTSALARHDLLDEIPAQHELALPLGAHLPSMGERVRWHKYDPATFEIGRGTATLTPGLDIGIFDAERSLVDAFNPRIGLPREQAVEALRAWLRRRGSQPASLLDIARHWPHARAGLLAVLQVLA